MTYDVIIIGAGAAGLAAARDLAGSGRKICLLEARQRIGGRVFSLHLPPLPLPIELGAEFIHGASETTFGIVHAAGLAAAELPDTHWWARGGSWTLVEDYWGEIDEVRAKIGPRKRDVSFDEFLRTRRGLSARQKELARTFVEGYHASYAERISTAVLRTADGEQEQPGGNRQFRLAGGQNGIVDFLRAGLHPDHAEVRLGTVATAVTWSDGRVSVTCRSAQTRHEETLRARALLLTLPIGVWKAAQEQEGAVRFDPPLREKQRALDLIEPGHVVKVALRFRESFWASPEFTRERTASRQWQRGLPLNFVHLAGQPLPTWWTSAPFLAPILTGWAGGPAADMLLAEGEEAILDRALESLAAGWRVSRPRLDSLLVSSFLHDWQRDPFSRCAYSYAAVGGQNAHAVLARPLRNTLFFAGEATSGDETGTVAGAIESGRRAAREILRS